MSFTKGGGGGGSQEQPLTAGYCNYGMHNLNDISDSEEEVFVYDAAGEPVDLDPNSRKVVSKVPLIKRRGKRGKPTNSLYFNCLMLALKFLFVSSSSYRICIRKRWHQEGEGKVQLPDWFSPQDAPV